MKFLITLLDGLFLIALIWVGTGLLSGKQHSTLTAYQYNGMIILFRGIILAFIVLIGTVIIGVKRQTGITTARVFERVDTLFLAIVGTLVGLGLLELYTSIFGFYR